MLHHLLASILSIFSFSSSWRSNSKPHFLFNRSNRVLIPRIPHLPIVCSQTLSDVFLFPTTNINQLRRLSFPSLSKSSVRESHVFFTATTGPRRCDLAIELLHNSTAHQLLESALVVSTSLPAQGSIHLIKLVVVVLICAQWSQLHIEVASDVEIFGPCSTRLP